MACVKVMSASLVVSLLLIALLQTTSAQNYHYSNGWYAGKKRSSAGSTISSETSSTSASTFDESCNMRPEAVLLINRIVQEEVARIQKSCFADVPSGLSQLLENAASKLEPDNKW